MTINHLHQNKSNREHGAFANDDGSVDPVMSSSVGDPSTDKIISITFPQEEHKTRMHTHPSGTKLIPRSNSSTFGGVSWSRASFSQPPSRKDITNASSSGVSRYVFGMSQINGKVQTIYIFNGNGVQATIPISTFRK